MAGPTVSAPRVEAIIFDMDGTMVDSMPWHARAWGEFARRRGLALDVDDLMRRTTGRNAYECACELMERVVSAGNFEQGKDGLMITLIFDEQDQK